MSIWQFNEIKKQLEGINTFVTLDEGNTKVNEFKDGKNTLLLKREDHNPTGSWKDRGTAFKITELTSKGIQEAVISSSGNAAISFLTYAKVLKDFKLHIVISPNANPKKREIIEKLVKEGNHELYIEKSAKSKASEIAGAKKIPILKSSIDSEILKGYWSLGYELAPIIKKYRDKNNILLCAVSSGTTLVGLIQGLFSILEREYLLPKVYICQTQSVHPLIEEIPESNVPSFADAIVDRSVLRKPQIDKVINETSGGKLVITNEMLERAKTFSIENQIQDLSFTSLLPIAGYLELKEKLEGSNFICITSGR